MNTFEIATARSLVGNSENSSMTTSIKRHAALAQASTSRTCTHLVILRAYRRAADTRQEGKGHKRSLFIRRFLAAQRSTRGDPGVASHPILSPFCLGVDDSRLVLSILISSVAVLPILISSVASSHLVSFRSFNQRLAGGNSMHAQARQFQHRDEIPQVGHPSTQQRD